MKIGIMTVNDNTFHPNARFMAEADKLGHELVLIDPYGVACCVDNHDSKLFFKPDTMVDPDFNYKENLPDLILPRQGSPMGEYGFVLLRHFAMLNVPLINGIDGITISKHQYITLQQLSRAGVCVPRAFFVIRQDNFFAAVQALGGYPVVAKLVDGMGGQGVVKLKDKDAAKDYLDAFFIPGKGVVLEPFIPHECALRLLVVDGKVASAISLTPSPGQFKANIHQQSVSCAFQPDKKIADIAVRSARACCLDIAGVDMIVTKDRGPLVLEVNYSPGFRGLEAATGKNIAKIILDCAISLSGNRVVKKEVQ